MRYWLSGIWNFKSVALAKFRRSRGGRTVIFVSHDFSVGSIVVHFSDNLIREKASEKMSPENLFESFRNYLRDICRFSDLTNLIIDRNNPISRDSKCFTMNVKWAGHSSSVRSVENSLGICGPYPITPVIEVAVRTTTGARLFAVSNQWCGRRENESGQLSEGGVECDFGPLPLMPGSYTLQVALLNEYRAFHVIREAFRLEVERRISWELDEATPRTRFTHISRHVSSLLNSTV